MTPDETEVVKTQLELEKLRQEIAELESTTRRNNAWYQGPLDILPFLTAIVGIGALAGTLWKQSKDLAQQRRAEEHQRERDREERREADQRRFDESFTTTIQNLASERAAVQITAAAVLPTYLKEEYSDFHQQTLLLIIACLKSDPDRELNLTVSRLLVHAFEKALPIWLARSDRDDSLDLANTQLRRATFDQLDFAGVEVDLAFADLRNASFRSTILKRVRAGEANASHSVWSGANLFQARMNGLRGDDARFHGSNLISSTLKTASLQRAQFQEAKLQSAHFEGADLRGARFEQADLNDTYFQGATLDAPALESITKAFNWREAHFDEEISDRLRDATS